MTQSVPYCLNCGTLLVRVEEHGEEAWVCPSCREDLVPAEPAGEEESRD